MKSELKMCNPFKILKKTKRPERSLLDEALFQWIDHDTDFHTNDNGSYIHIMDNGTDMDRESISIGDIKHRVRDNENFKRATRRTIPAPRSDSNYWKLN